MNGMNPQQVKELLTWLSKQIEHSKRAIDEAHETHNFGREAMNEGMREAYMQCLKWVNLMENI